MNTLDLTRNVVKTDQYDEINQVIPKGIGVWGYEGMRLSRLAADVPEGGVIVEIGSFRGRSAAFMASALRQMGHSIRTKIYCIDIWEDVAHMEAADNGLSKLGLREYTLLLRDNSLFVAKHWELPIDLLFIDGAHDYASARADFDAWLPHVLRSKVIVFHDYNLHWPGVVRLVEEVKDKQVQKVQLTKFLWDGIKL